MSFHQEKAKCVYELWSIGTLISWQTFWYGSLLLLLHCHCYRVVTLRSDRPAHCCALGNPGCVSTDLLNPYVVQQNKISFETILLVQRSCWKCFACACKHVLQCKTTRWFTCCSSSGKILYFHQVFVMWGDFFCTLCLSMCPTKMWCLGNELTVNLNKYLTKHVTFCDFGVNWLSAPLLSPVESSHTVFLPSVVSGKILFKIKLIYFLSAYKK